MKYFNFIMAIGLVCFFILLCNEWNQLKHGTQMVDGVSPARLQHLGERVYALEKSIEIYSDQNAELVIFLQTQSRVAHDLDLRQDASQAIIMQNQERIEGLEKRKHVKE